MAARAETVSARAKADSRENWKQLAIARKVGRIIFKIAADALPWFDNPISGLADAGNANWTESTAKTLNSNK